MIDGRHVLHGLLPFVPVVVGIGIKFALIDNPGENVSEYLFDEYMRPAWIEFLVTAYVMGLAAMLSQQRLNKALPRVDILIYAAVPAICFVVCLILVAGTAKAGLKSDFWQVYVPAVLAAVNLAVSGGRIGNEH
jgi:peptidoglycan/LPS O-acetylase OafA/YrhL